MKLLLLLAILAQAGDIYTTYVGVVLRHGVEYNPVARWLIKALGFWPGVLLLKAVGLSVVGFFSYSLGFFWLFLLGATLYGAFATWYNSKDWK